MKSENLFETSRAKLGELLARPPFLWPEARFLAGQARYAVVPPVQSLFAEADLISGLLVGAAGGTIQWIDELFRSDRKQRVYLVLVLFPAGPTREEHLRAIENLCVANASSEKTVEVRLMPMTDHVDKDYKRTVLPPTVIQAHNTQTGRTVMSIGSVGDAGHDPVSVGSLNFVFQPDDAMRDAWRRWFQYIFSSAAPLTTDTLQIPHLVPAKGDPDAARLWKEFELACQGKNPATNTPPKVDPETGEVKTDSNAKQLVPWDAGKTALEPLALVFQQVYANGWLVTVDEATRIKPLTIPVKAKLLGLQSERNVGALKQKQSFSLQVLDNTVDKAIEKCRKVTDVMELLTYPLSQGNRWLPEATKSLFEKELESRNEQGQKTLREALGSNDIKQFIAKRSASIRKDLNDMYSQLDQDDAVPEDKFKIVLDEVEERLTQALDTRITPRAVYNRIGAPDLTTNAPDENWNQPLSLLERCARIMRESLTDSYFPRRFSGLSFSEDDFRKGCDAFEDDFVKVLDRNRAMKELAMLDNIMKGNQSAKEKCKAVWLLIKKGESALKT